MFSDDKIKSIIESFKAGFSLDPPEITPVNTGLVLLRTIRLLLVKCSGLHHEPVITPGVGYYAVC
jgi:hypothetical protein